MKRLLFAVAVACLFAVNAIAADPPATTTVPSPVPSGTVIAPTAPTVVTTTSTTSTRRYGLFSRLRNRMSGTVYSSPAMSATPGTVITPAPATVAPGTVVPTPMPMPSTSPKPIETSGTASGVVTTSGGTVVNGMPMTSTTTVMPVATTTSTRTRMGLLNRLRLRR